MNGEVLAAAIDAAMTSMAKDKTIEDAIFRVHLEVFKRLKLHAHFLAYKLVREEAIQVVVDSVNRKRANGVTT